MKADHLRAGLDATHMRLGKEKHNISPASLERLRDQDLRQLILDTFASVDVYYRSGIPTMLSPEDMIFSNAFAHEETLRQWAKLHGVSLDA